MPIPRSSTRPGGNGTAATAAACRRVEARDLAADHLQVVLRVPVGTERSRYPRRLDGRPTDRSRGARAAQRRRRLASSSTCRREPPVLGGEALALETDADPAAHRRLPDDLGVRAAPARPRRSLVGTCARCLGPARLVLDIDAREVDQVKADPDGELKSPYIADELLDPDAWLRRCDRARASPSGCSAGPTAPACARSAAISLNDVDPADPRARAGARSALREAARPLE